MNSFIQFIALVCDDVKVFFFQCSLFRSKDKLDRIFGILMWGCLAVLMYALICLFRYI
jgi:hypothetical protein